MAFTLTDGVFGGVLLLSLLLGLWRGLVHELMSLAGWVVAFVLSQWLASDVADWLPVWRDAAAQVRYAFSFVLVFVAGMMAMGLLAWLLGKVVATVGLQPVDRGLGGMFGLMRGVLILLVLTVFVHLVGMQRDAWWREAQLSPLLEIVLAGVKPVLPERVQEYLP
jgi:membrane protein required for colicin V production